MRWKQHHDDVLRVCHDATPPQRRAWLFWAEMAQAFNREFRLDLSESAIEVHGHRIGLESKRTPRAPYTLVCPKCGGIKPGHTAKVCFGCHIEKRRLG